MSWHYWTILVGRGPGCIKSTSKMLVGIGYNFLWFERSSLHPSPKYLADPRVEDPRSARKLSRLFRHTLRIKIDALSNIIKIKYHLAKSFHIWIWYIFPDISMCIALIDNPSIVYNENPCAWLLWHWSSRGQLALWNPRGRVGSKFNWPSEDQCRRSHSKWVFVFIPHLKSKYSQLIVSKLPRKSAICPLRSPWRLIVLVRSLRSAQLDTAWLVKSVTYFNLIG